MNILLNNTVLVAMANLLVAIAQAVQTPNPKRP